MKRIVVVLLLALGVSAMAQENINLGVIPTPQEVVMDENGKMCVWKKAKVKEVGVDNYEIDILKNAYLRHVQANVDQAYALNIEPKRITIEYYRGEEGLKYAYMTLEQLKRIYGDTLPCCTILDWPAYRYRGWMDDQSRGPVPHAAYRKKQWETLHALKFNFCNYYTEHTLYQPEFPDLAPAYLADCKPHPDEVINLQLFAHAEKTLRIPFYQHLMDSKANFDPGNEATYDFLRKRIKAAYDRIPNSPFFIINCDETEQLGTGRAKKLVDSKGADQVYVDFINRCYDLVQQAGSTRVAMWGDIVAKNPAMMRQLPKDMTYIMWAYEPLDSYDHLIRPFKENGTPFWVAPSLSHSSNMIPNPYRYMKNIANLARDGWRNGAEGLMNTCWDDNGEALFDNCWHGLFWSAEMAWNPIKTDDPEEFARREKQFNENFERLFYQDEGVRGSEKGVKGSERTNVQDYAPLTSQLYAVGALMYNPDVADWYTSAALLEPLLNFNPDNTDGTAVYSRVAKVLKALDTITVSYQNPHAAYALERIKATVKKALLRHSIYKLLQGDKQEGVDLEGTIKDNAYSYFQDLYYLKKFYLILWDHENGDYERYIVLNRYDDLAREVLELDRHVFMSLTPSPSPLGEGSRYPMVQLRTLYNDRPIFYTLDGSEPTASSTKYEGPFPLERSATIKAISYNEYGEGVVSEQYLLSHLGMGAKITLNTQYSTYKAIYSGGGTEALIDGQLGSNTTYADGHWQGYWGDSIDVMIDVGGRSSEVGVREVSMRFMQNTFDWILAPKEIKVYASKDGKEWTLVADKQFKMDPRETGMRLKNYTVPLSVPLSTFHFPLIRIVVPNPGPLPSWHPAPGQPSYLFTDEIIVK
jgi:hypothetical protein